MRDPIDLTGLDYAFLRYTGVNPSDQRKNQSFYLPFFNGCRRVVDLGCGDGDFVQLLIEQGIDAVGLDSDPLAVENARRRGLPIVDQDVLAYLENAEAASADGVFAAHLVEHLPYQAVYQLIAHAHRVLKPGGRIVLATPNARGLVSHLEMYWLHFGHVSFYHPRLLCFFLNHAGFRAETWGENPAPGYPLLGDIRVRLQALRLDADSADPVRPNGIRWEASVSRAELPGWRNFLRVRLARLLGLDSIANQVNAQLSAQRARLASEMIDLIERLDRPFECYATAVKP
ncbi:MAG: class I SAM-dependent methyltransferase [Anaerolineae bacterium]